MTADREARARAALDEWEHGTKVEIATNPFNWGGEMLLGCIDDARATLDQHGRWHKDAGDACGESWWPCRFRNQVLDRWAPDTTTPGN